MQWIGLGRAPLLRLVLAIVLVLLAVVLLLHLIGMDHSGGMSMIGTCLFLLVAALVLAAPESAWRAVPGMAARVNARWPHQAEPVCRPPPRDGPLRGVVLVC